MLIFTTCPPFLKSLHHFTKIQFAHTLMCVYTEVTLLHEIQYSCLPQTIDIGLQISYFCVVTSVSRVTMLNL